MLFTQDPREMPAVITPLSFRDAAEVFAAAFAQLFEQEPSKSTLACLLAQSALETGRWKKMFQFNVGNVKASASYPGRHQYMRCNEVLNGKVVWFDPPHPQTRFRAYDNPIDGVREHLRFLGKPRYARAFAAALNGEPGVFCEQLKLAGYFTANLTSYTKAVTSLFSEYFLELAREPVEVSLPPEPKPEVAPRSAFSGEDMLDLLPHLELTETDWEMMRTERDAAIQDYEHEPVETTKKRA